MAADDLSELELMLNRFRRLLGEVIRGATARNTFESWELAILLDFIQCKLNRRRRLDTLRQYGKAVERQMAKGPGPPMKLSEFLERKQHRPDPSLVETECRAVD
ncbi:conserved hypothetical protein [Candidatus Sulfopaludibacter sp. SbA3]|nr:conserved hypothetical protein [Candidatus Sulfopaludibacter sp. SbA3]